MLHLRFWKCKWKWFIVWDIFKFFKKGHFCVLRLWMMNQPEVENFYHKSFISAMGLSLFNRNLALAEWEINKSLVPQSPLLCLVTIIPCLCHPYDRKKEVVNTTLTHTGHTVQKKMGGGFNNAENASQFYVLTCKLVSPVLKNKENRSSIILFWGKNWTQEED